VSRFIVCRACTIVAKNPKTGFGICGLASVFVIVVLVSLPLAQAAGFTLSPPYPAGTAAIFNKPATWTFGTGGLTFPGSAPNSATGGVILDPHAHSDSPSGGTWGTNDAESGFSIPFTWTGTTGTHTLKFNWKDAYMLLGSITCIPGRVTVSLDIWANVTTSSGTYISGTSSAVAGFTINTVTAKSVMKSTATATLSFSATLASGSSYQAVSYLEGYDYTTSACQAGQTGSSIGEVDVGNFYIGSGLTSVVIT